MICIWSSWCIATPSSLPSSKSRMMYLSSAWLLGTQVVLEWRPMNVYCIHTHEHCSVDISGNNMHIVYLYVVIISYSLIIQCATHVMSYCLCWWCAQLLLIFTVICALVVLFGSCCKRRPRSTGCKLLLVLAACPVYDCCCIAVLHIFYTGISWNKRVTEQVILVTD